MLATMKQMTHNEFMEQLIGTRTAAQIMGVSRSTVNRMAAAGLLRPAAKLPGTLGANLFERCEIEEIAAKEGAR
ncbi:hypothetical protein AY477_00165 [Corynebacterium diphtheriae bv. mitis]|nr:hypothetical protein AY477_00165 [Corynebacterium diphtheriae bv. mitis]